MKGILFKEAMFNAVVEGRKTQMRQVMKSQPEINCQYPVNILKNKKGKWFCAVKVPPYRPFGDLNIKPRYKVGETLYLKEQAKYARYFIEITGVRCEKVQDISRLDCDKEGIRSRVKGVPPYDLIYQVPGSPNYYYTTKQAYAALFDKINGKGAWESNPYVWVYDFKLKDK